MATFLNNAKQFSFDGQDNAEPLTESFRQSGLRVDRENCVIRGCRVLGKESRNRRSYHASAIADTVRLLREGIPVAFGHKDERDYGDRNGQLYEGYEQDGSAFANWRLNPEDPRTKKVLWDAEFCPTNLALSIEVPRDGYTGAFNKNGIHEIQRIHRLPDVAVVAAGGTNRSLFESEDPSMSTVSEIKSITDLRESYPELCERLLVEAKETTDKDKLIEQLQKEVADGKSTIDSLEKNIRESYEKQRRDQRRQELREKAEQEKVVLTDKLLERFAPTDLEKPMPADDELADIWEGLARVVDERAMDGPFSSGQQRKSTPTASGTQLSSATTKGHSDQNLADELLATVKR